MFMSQVQDLRKEMNQLRQQVGMSNQRVWQNQQQIANGLDAAEEHMILIRRVLNDALSGVTRVKRIERPEEDGEAAEEVQVIDWDWYSEHLRACQSVGKFLYGVENKEEIEARAKAQELAKKQAQAETVAAHLFQDGTTHDEIEKGEWEKVFGRTKIKDVLLKDDELGNMVRSELAKAVAAKKEAMEGAASELLEESKEFAEEAGKAVEAINAGDEEEAQRAMAELKRRVKEKEEEADQVDLPPPHPEGATIFGGS